MASGAQQLSLATRRSNVKARRLVRWSRVADDAPLPEEGGYLLRLFPGNDTDTGWHRRPACVCTEM